MFSIPIYVIHWDTYIYVYPFKCSATLEYQYMLTLQFCIFHVQIPTTRWDEWVPCSVLVFQLPCRKQYMGLSQSILCFLFLLLLLQTTHCNFMRKDQSKCDVTITMFLFELNVSVHWLKFRELCCTVVAVCIMHMCTYGFKRYFHSTWNSTLLIKVWLGVIFKSLSCNQQIWFVCFWVAVLGVCSRLNL